MDGQLIDIGWSIVKAILSVAVGMGIWTLKKADAKQEKHEERITELEKNQAVHQARYDQWLDLGQPERRK